MGVVYTNLILSNPSKPKLKPIKIEALVDTGALNLCIPKHVALQLKLKEIEKREVALADDRKIIVPYVGPILISWEDRHCYVGAMVMGDETLLGAIPLEAMDLIVNPSAQKLLANPETPNIPGSIAKSFNPSL
jgi:clan AA aspartic protease